MLYRFTKWNGGLPSLLLTCCLLFTANAHSATKTLLVLGDSLSAGYGLARGTGWINLLEKRLQQDTIDYQVVNASISGETTSGGKTRIAKLVEVHRPAVVLVELGGNDALRGLSLDETQKNLRVIIETARSAKARVILLGMQIPPNYGPDYTRRFSMLFAELAKQTQSAFVPFFLEQVVLQPNLFQSDRIHPNEQAQALMLANVWPQLLPLLKK